MKTKMIEIHIITELFQVMISSRANSKLKSKIKRFKEFKNFGYIVHIENPNVVELHNINGVSGVFNVEVKDNEPIVSGINMPLRKLINCNFCNNHFEVDVDNEILYMINFADNFSPVKAKEIINSLLN